MSAAQQKAAVQAAPSADQPKRLHDDKAISSQGKAAGNGGHIDVSAGTSCATTVTGAGTTTVLSRFTITDMGPVEPKEPSQNSRARSVSVAGPPPAESTGQPRFPQNRARSSHALRLAEAEENMAPEQAAQAVPGEPPTAGQMAPVAAAPPTQAGPGPSPIIAPVAYPPASSMQAQGSRPGAAAVPHVQRLPQQATKVAVLATTQGAIGPDGRAVIHTFAKQQHGVLHATSSLPALPRGPVIQVPVGATMPQGDGATAAPQHSSPYPQQPLLHQAMHPQVIGLQQPLSQSGGMAAASTTPRVTVPAAQPAADNFVVSLSHVFSQQLQQGSAISHMLKIMTNQQDGSRPGSDSLFPFLGLTAVNKSQEQLAQMQSELRSLHALCHAQQQMLAALANSGQINSPAPTAQMQQPPALSRPPSMNEFLTLSAEHDEFLLCPTRPPPTPTIPGGDHHHHSEPALCAPHLHLQRQRSHTTEYHTASEHAPVTRVQSLPPSPRTARYPGSAGRQAQRISGASVDRFITTTAAVPKNVAVAPTTTDGADHADGQASEDGDLSTALALLDMQNEALRAENQDLRLKYQELARDNVRL